MLLAQTYQTTSSSGGAGAALGVFLLFYLVIFAFVLFAWARIITKAGYSGVWVLVGLIPIVNLVMFFVFAFSDWPALHGHRSSGPPAGYGYGTPGYGPPPAASGADPRFGYGAQYTPPGSAPTGGFAPSGGVAAPRAQPAPGPSTPLPTWGAPPPGPQR
ncbi:MAG TPA: hypothetical protein VL856_18545 [Acidimicrobiia bacterium]|jgi:energy-coupling factor transporter transmembrane protein EcfT|nr:hypothetical protein [Acidimicrobiia bacterium]